MILLLYAATAAALLVLCHRAVQPLSRTAAMLLFVLPFCFTGRALLTGAVYAPIDLPYAAPPLAGLKAEVGIGEPHNVTLSDLYTQVIPWR